MSSCAVGVARVWRLRRNSLASPLLQCRRLTGGEWTHDDFLDLCRRRNFLLGKKMTPASVLGGHHTLGPLGAQMKMNLLHKWWEAMVLHRDQVLPIDSLCHLPRTCDPSLTPALKTLPQSLLHRNPTREELEKMPDLRQDLLYGALYNYPSYLELMNRKLPFGIAEVGRCFHPITDDGDTCRAGEGTAASLVWFSSAKTCGQWQDYWLRQRLLWWRKFAQVPSRFSSGDHHDEAGRTSFVIRYDFPWGEEPIERISSMDDSILTKVHEEATGDLQARDGRKFMVPHVVWVSSDVERGLVAYLCDALQVMRSPGAQRKEQQQQRTVLKIHPLLAPVKVAVDMGSGPAAELRLVCEGLCSELRGKGMSVWPGYRETVQGRTEQLHTKYDEMGVPFAALVSDITLESGLIQLRSRDTTIKETMHISKLGAFLTQHMASAEKL